MRPTRTPEQFAKDFWNGASRDEKSGCLVWNKATDGHGYAYTWHKGKVQRAARVAYELNHGQEANGYVLHTCDNRKCIEPSHLYNGTQKQNAQDTVTRGRWSGNVILTEEKIALVQKALSLGLTQAEVAALCGCHRSTISHLNRRQKCPKV